MPFNGSGLFQRVVASFAGARLWQDQAEAQASGGHPGPINQEYFDVADQDMADALSNCVTRDGQSPATANLPMGGFRHTNVSDGTSPNQYATVNQLINSGTRYAGTAGGTLNALTMAISPAPTAYVAGMIVGFKALLTNSGAVTVNLNSLGVVPLRSWQDGAVELGPGDLMAGGSYEMVYVGPTFGFQLYNHNDKAKNIRYFAGTAGGSGNAITLTTVPFFNQFQDGLIVGFRALANNTGATSVAVNGVALPLRKWDSPGTDLAPGDIMPNATYEIVFDAANNRFNLFNATPQDLFYRTSAVGGTGDAITVTTDPPFRGYIDGSKITLVSTADNGGPVTLNVNGTGAVPLRKWGLPSNSLSPAEIQANAAYEVRFNAAAGVWQLFGNTGVASRVWGSPTIDAVGAATIMSSTVHYFRYQRQAHGLVEAWFSFTFALNVADAYVVTIDIPHSSASVGSDWAGTAHHYHGNRYIPCGCWMSGNLIAFSNGEPSGAGTPIGGDLWKVDVGNYKIIGHIRYEMP